MNDNIRLFFTLGFLIVAATIATILIVQTIEIHVKINRYHELLKQGETK